VPGERGVPDGIYAERHTVERSAPQPMLNRRPTEAKRDELPVRHDTSLTRGEFGDLPITWAALGAISPTMRPTSVMGATLAVPQAQQGYERNDR
jgi:hypothetical protein